MIRKVNSEDYPSLLDIQVTCIRGLTHVYSTDEIRTWIDYIASEGAARYSQYENRVFVSDDGSIVGFVSWSQGHDKQAAIECLYVLPEFRDQGIGRLLLREAETDFTEDITIRIRSTLNALLFYERQGYRCTGDTTSRAGFRIKLLEKTLSPDVSDE